MHATYQNTMFRADFGMEEYFLHYNWQQQSFNVQQRLSTGLNISFNYDGRKANSVGAVHTGRTQVSVLF